MRQLILTVEQYDSERGETRPVLILVDPDVVERAIAAISALTLALAGNSELGAPGAENVVPFRRLTDDEEPR